MGSVLKWWVSGFRYFSCSAFQLFEQSLHRIYFSQYIVLCEPRRDGLLDLILIVSGLQFCNVELLHLQHRHHCSLRF